MKRTRRYYSATRERVEKTALERVRRTREQLDPAVLSSVTKKMEDSGVMDELKRTLFKPEVINGEVPVDRKKNVMIVMKFLEKNPDNKNVMKLVTAMLEEDN